MAPKKSKQPSKTEKAMDKSPPHVDIENDANETTGSKTTAAAVKDAPPGSSKPGEATTHKPMDLRRTPCLACLEHLIGWMPSDEGVMYCQEGTTKGTCARCEYSSMECKSARGVLKKPASILHTALSNTFRYPDSIKHFQDSVRRKLEAEKIRSCENDRDWFTEELWEKMEPFFEGLRRRSRLEGFSRAMDLAMETVKNCRGGCHCMLRGCTQGSKAAIDVAQGDDGTRSWLQSLGVQKEEEGKMVRPAEEKAASKTEAGEKQKTV